VEINLKKFAKRVVVVDIDVMINCYAKNFPNKESIMSSQHISFVQSPFQNIRVCYFIKSFLKFDINLRRVRKMSERGSLGLAVFVGFILMIILGWFPIIGPLIAGFVAGLIARGAGRGALAGFLSGIIGGIIIGVILTIIGTAALGALGTFLGILAGLVVIILSLGGAILALIGGAIGGLIRG